MKLHSRRYSLSLILLITACLQVLAQEQSFTDPGGKWTVTPYPSGIVKVTYHPNGYTRNEQVTGAVIARPLSGVPVKAALVKGELRLENRVTLQLAAMPEKEGYRGFRIRLQPGEKIYGGGERALPLNRRGYRLPLYNNPWYGYSNGADALNFSVPFFTSSAGYGVFFDNGSKGYADLGRTEPDVLEAGFVSGELTVYILSGRTPADLLSAYYRLTGTQPLPPRWALGNYMSRFGYTSEAQTRSIAAQMRAAGIPFDAVIFDLFWFGDSIKNTLGNLDWVNREKWPDPKGMISRFSQEGVQSVLIAEPFILKGTRQYQSSLPFHATDSAGRPFTLQDFYFGYGGLLDIFRKDAGNWIWDTHYRKQIANGVHAWWTDLGEPEKHPAAILHNLRDQGVQRKMGAEEVHNLYGHYWNRMLDGQYRRHYPNRRLFHLNRSGFAGSQRYSIFPWSGDVSRSWSGLQVQLPLMLGMSMSGIPYIHADAGGFAGGEGDAELYVRWLQYAVYTPVFRPHGTALFGVDPNTFNFPSEPALIDSPYRGMAREAVYQRYRLLPYNYTLAWRHTRYREPLVAPLYYHFPADTGTANIQDQFMWGNQLLVAPILEKGLRERKVYLPAGTWYPLQNGGSISGGQWIQAVAGLHETPVYVKGGSFLPLYLPDTLANANAGAYQGEGLTVLYYPSPAASEYVLYEDDGISRNSKPEQLTFRAVRSGNRLKITIRTDQPGRYSKGRKRTLKMGNVTIQDSGAPVYINGRRISLTGQQSFRWPGSAGFSIPLLPVEFEGKPVTLIFQITEP